MGNQYMQRAMPQMMFKPQHGMMPQMMPHMMPQMMPHMMPQMLPQMMQQMREMQQSMGQSMPMMPKVMFVPVPVPVMAENGADPDLYGSKGKPLLESYVPGLRASAASNRNKRTARRTDAAPREGTKKIFVGGLCPDSTADSLRAHFQQFGEIADCVVINQAGTKKCRGFGFVEFADRIPEGLFDRQHSVDQRRCGVKPYDYVVDESEEADKA
jgi:hypothetical protein